MGQSDYHALYYMRVSTGSPTATVQAVFERRTAKEQVTSCKTALKSNICSGHWVSKRRTPS